MEVENPAVWRRVIVPGRYTFFRFHRVIQAAFGWENAHLFQFSPKGWGSEPAIGLLLEDDEMNTQDCKKIKLSQIFSKPQQSYTYIYDFGDNWLHRILLEKVIDENLERAVLVEGEGVCPPEDCGGVWGYEELKAVMADCGHEEHESMKEWLGLGPDERWNAGAFDLKRAQEAVNKV
jgi:Plasmid pRiA4b ORF-3-like protein